MFIHRGAEVRTDVKRATAENTDFHALGLFEPRHTAFIENIASLRRKLHRYCARMTGSIFDGEDVAQEVIFEAYCKLSTFDDARPLAPWLFRIAHNRCIDLIRRRGVRNEAETAASTSVSPIVSAPIGHGVGHALERLVIALPPKERACVLLKDVFDYSHEEIADLVGSTAGGVKAALNRGRTKLAGLVATPQLKHVALGADDLALLRLYVDRFNRHDWDGVRALASADARLCVADCFSGRLADSPYFLEYDRPLIQWRMTLGDVEGETAIVILRADAPRPTPYSAIRVGLRGGRVVSLVDYIKCAWILDGVEVRIDPTH
jgi:RNA polymerase sigma-70 factor, ECF subfamily